MDDPLPDAWPKIKILSIKYLIIYNGQQMKIISSISAEHSLATIVFENHEFLALNCRVKIYCGFKLLVLKDIQFPFH